MSVINTNVNSLIAHFPIVGYAEQCQSKYEPSTSQYRLEDQYRRPTIPPV